MMDGICRLSLMYLLIGGSGLFSGLAIFIDGQGERERERERSRTTGAHAKSAWQNTVVIRCEDDGVVVPVSLYVVVRVRVVQIELPGEEEEEEECQKTLVLVHSPLGLLSLLFFLSVNVYTCPFF